MADTTTGASALEGQKTHMDTRHPPFHRLADLAEGMLDGSERATVQRHVSDCARCSNDVDWLGRTIALMRTDQTEAAPEHVVKRAVRLFAQRRPSVHADVVQHLIGVLRFDSAGAAPAFGLRVGADDAMRQMLYEAEEYEIELRTSTAANGATVVGQLLGAAGPLESADVELVGAEARVRTRLTDLLEFSLPAVPPGIYRLELRLDSSTAIEIPSLNLG
jgi:hypothetical protein